MPIINLNDKTAKEKRLEKIAIEVAKSYLSDENLIIAMATVFNQNGYKFAFPSADALNEPLHVHVKKERSSAKFWVKDDKFGKKDIAESEWNHSCKLARNNGFKQEQLNEIARIIEERRDEIALKWETEKAKGNNAGRVPDSNK